ADDGEAVPPRTAPAAADSPHEAGRFGVFAHLTTEGADVYGLGRSGPVGTHVWAFGVCPGPARFRRDRAIATVEGVRGDVGVPRGLRLGVGGYCTGAGGR